MLIEAFIPLRVRLTSGEVRLRPGHPVRFPDADGRKLLARAPGKVHCVMPEPPLQPGWLVAYRGPQGRLRGGCDERDAGTVVACEWNGTFWTVGLTNGETIPLQRITSVAKTDGAGKILAAWDVRAHGHDGEGAGR